MGNGVLETSGAIDQEARQFLGKAVEGMASDIIVTFDNNAFIILSEMGARLYLHKIIYPESWCTSLHGDVD